MGELVLDCEGRLGCLLLVHWKLGFSNGRVIMPAGLRKSWSPADWATSPDPFYIAKPRWPCNRGHFHRNPSSRIVIYCLLINAKAKSWACSPISLELKPFILFYVCHMGVTSSQFHMSDFLQVWVLNPPAWLFPRVPLSCCRMTHLLTLPQLIGHWILTDRWCFHSVHRRLSGHDPCQPSWKPLSVLLALRFCTLCWSTAQSHTFWLLCFLSLCHLTSIFFLAYRDD